MRRLTRRLSAGSNIPDRHSQRSTSVVVPGIGSVLRASEKLRPGGSIARLPKSWNTDSAAHLHLEQSSPPRQDGQVELLSNSRTNLPEPRWTHENSSRA